MSLASQRLHCQSVPLVDSRDSSNLRSGSMSRLDSPSSQKSHPLGFAHLCRSLPSGSIASPFHWWTRATRPTCGQGLCHGLTRLLPRSLTLSGLPIYVARFPAAPLPVRSIGGLARLVQPAVRVYVTA